MTKKHLKNDGNSLILDTKSHLKKVGEQMKREAIINFNHPYSVWQDKNGRWQTYLPDETRTRKIKLISSANKEKLEKRLCNFYNNRTPTFETIFYEWMDRKLELKQIVDSTYTRMESDYNRFFRNEIGVMQINMLTIDDYVDFMEEQIAKHDLSVKGFNNMKSIVKGTVNRARKMHYIDFSGLDVINEFSVMSEATFRKVVKKDEQEVYDEEETALVIDKLSRSNDSMDLCLLLIFVTGLRVGEAVALKHDDFVGNTVKVSKTERKYKKFGCPVIEVVEKTKTVNGNRTVIIPSSYEWLVNKIQRLNPFGEYCFIGKRNKRLLTANIQRRLRIVCDELNIPHRSPHKIRKTYLSILLDNGVDDNMVIQQAGHSSITTTELYYHWNRKNEERKRAIIDSIPELNPTKNVDNSTKTIEIAR